jgi:hypothetical protein
LEPLVNLDQRYDRGNGHKAIIVQGISPVLKGQFSITIDSMASKHQTVILEQGTEWEIVLELRPRRLTQIERVKLCNAK